MNFFLWFCMAFCDVKYCNCKQTIEIWNDLKVQNSLALEYKETSYYFILIEILILEFLANIFDIKNHWNTLGIVKFTVKYKVNNVTVLQFFMAFTLLPRPNFFMFIWTIFLYIYYLNYIFIYYIYYLNLIFIFSVFIWSCYNTL